MKNDITFYLLSLLFSSSLPYLCLPLPWSFCLVFSLFVSDCLSLSLCLFVCLSLSLSLSLSGCLALSLSLSSLCLSLCLTPSLCLSLCLTLSLSLSLSVSLSLSQSFWRSYLTRKQLRGDTGKKKKGKGKGKGKGKKGTKKRWQPGLTIDRHIPVKTCVVAKFQLFFDLIFALTVPRVTNL